MRWEAEGAKFSSTGLITVDRFSHFSLIRQTADWLILHMHLTDACLVRCCRHTLVTTNTWGRRAFPDRYY